MTDRPRTAALDALWHELTLDALASDGPIRDSDVKDAIKRKRTRIEAEAATLDRAALALALHETTCGDAVGTDPNEDDVAEAGVLAAAYEKALKEMGGD